MMHVFENLKDLFRNGKQSPQPFFEGAEPDKVSSEATIQNSEREQFAKGYLEAMIRRCTIFIDTCELLNEKFPLLFDNMTPFLRQHDKKLMIPSGVETELKNLFFKKPELQEQIMNVLILIKQKKAEGLIASCGRDGVTFADQQMLSIATGSLLSDEALFITRDRSLSEDILKLNELGSVHGKKVTVNRISKYGYLAKYTPFRPTSERECDPTLEKLSA